MALPADLLEKFIKIHELFDSLIKQETFLDAIESSIKNLEKSSASLGERRKRELWANALPNKIIKVQNRILLVKDLIARKNNAENFLQVYMYPGLITYLLLTCFDLLGQPQDFIPFQSWISAPRFSAEVKVIMASIEEEEEDQFLRDKNLCRDIYRRFLDIYGARRSFYRFFEEELPKEVARNLYDNILIEHWTEGQLVTVLNDAPGDKRKKSWLYEIRNNYTHNLSTPQQTLLIPVKDNWLRMEVNTRGAYDEVIWVSEVFTNVLEDCIKHSIIKKIKAEN